MVFCLISVEKASPLILLAYKPAWCACVSKAAVLYQPADAGLFCLGGFSKNTPIVAAFCPLFEFLF